MTVENHELPTERECPQCNTPMKAFTVQSRNPGIDVELDRCHACGGVWFDAGELEIATGRSVIKSKSASDRYCPKCLIPLLNADLTTGVAVDCNAIRNAHAIKAPTSTPATSRSSRSTRPSSPPRT